MKICLCHVKTNRPLFTFLYNSVITGLQKQKIKYVTSLSQDDVPDDCDHYFLFTNTLSKTNKILADKKKNIHTFIISPLQKKFILQLEQQNNLNNDDTLVYIETLKRGYIQLPKTDTPRFDFDLPIKSWRKSGLNIIIPEQIFPEGYVDGYNLQTIKNSFKKWLGETVTKIREVTDSPIIVAAKPNRCDILANNPGINTNYDFDGIDITIGSAIQQVGFAHTLASISSKSVFEYIINGVPCFLADTSSLAYEVCGHNYHNIMVPKLFDRFQWLNRISNIHFSIDEIKDGSYIHEWSREVGR